MNHIEAKTAGICFVIFLSLLLIAPIGLKAAGAADSKATFTVQ